MYEINVEIKGASPLLMHRFGEETADKPTTKRTGRPDYSKQAEKALYLLDDGKTIYTPSSHIEGTLREAGKQFKITGKGKSNFSKLMGSSVNVTPDAIPHKIQAWKVDARPVVIQRSRIMRYRPRFDEWKLAFRIEVMDDDIPFDVVNQILTHAGTYVGIGDFRPDKKGKFGRFTVTRFEQNK